MTAGQIAKKYSKALINNFDTADIPGILNGLRLFEGLINKNKKLRLLFDSRIFSEDEKTKALKAVLSHLRASHQTEKFLRLIIVNGHLSSIKEIIKASINAYNEKLKKVTATVISSVALEGGHVNRLRNALKYLTQREVDIENQIDPSLLGGFVVKVGSTVYDSSLRGQFKLLKAELTR